MKKKRKICLIILLLFLSCISFNELKMADAKSLFGRTTDNIIPKPVSYKKSSGKFQVDQNTVIYIKGNDEKENAELIKISGFLKDKFKIAAGFELNIISDFDTEELKDNGIYLTTFQGEESLGNEGYSLNSTKNNIKITAYKPEGVYRGIQTLIQMLPYEIENTNNEGNVKWIVNGALIYDKPVYDYRGFMIDVARHFFDIDEIKRQIDNAAQYKINKLHLHLSDDQGWRLEIKKYPDLTLIGGSTEVGGGKGGYYTQEQFKDIVKYAGDRYMEIIPEFDMPGHSNAALASYGFLNPDGERKPLYTGIDVGFSSFMTHSEETYEFIDDIFKEVSEISPSKYMHIGGDEALSTPKEDYDYFVGRVSKIAQKYGKTPIGWDPIDTSPEINSNTILENWKDSNEDARRKEMNMIIAIAKKAYLDMKYNKDTPYGLDWAGYIPIETAYNWDPTDYAPSNLILGLEAPLWTETISNVKQMDYMIYPRLLGYAEIGWTPKNLRDFNEYRIRLRNQAQRLKSENINFYEDPNIFN